MTRTEWEAFRAMKLADQGAVRTAEHWEACLNLKPGEARDGYRFAQGMLVLRRQ